MSKLAEFRHLEQQLAAQLAELENLKNHAGLKREIEFESKLRALLADYGYSLKNIIGILDPIATVSRAIDTNVRLTRKPRQVKVYKNPHSGEVVETKGGNHKTLKEWKVQYGAGEVENWLTS